MRNLVIQKYILYMSRIGKKAILIPEGVHVQIENSTITVKGPKGELSRTMRPEIELQMKEGKIFVSPKRGLDSKTMKKTPAFWGLTAALVRNMIEGVGKGFEKKLELVGIGYRASLEGDDLILSVGFTHPVKIARPEGIKFSIEKNIITISGPDKELVGQISARIRKVKPPEPYKGKGIRYVGEHIRRKLGKKAVGAGTK